MDKSIEKNSSGATFRKITVRHNKEDDTYTLTRNGEDVAVISSETYDKDSTHKIQWRGVELFTYGRARACEIADLLETGFQTQR